MLRRGKRIIGPPFPYAAAPAAAASTLKIGLVSFWEFEDAGSPPTSWADSHGTNHLTPHGTSNPSSTTTGIGGAGKKGIQLVSANTQYVGCSDNTSLRRGNKDWSLCAWINIATFHTDQEIISKIAGFGNGEFAIGTYFTSHNVFRIWIRTNDGQTTSTLDAETFGAISTGTPYFVVMTYTNSTNTVAVYVNGSANSNSVAVSNPPIANSTAAFNIGANDAAASNGYSDAVVDQVGLWDKVLLSSEIDQLHASGNGLSYANM